MNKDKFLSIPDDIKYLNTSSCIDNLFFYSYHNRYLKKLQQNDVDKEDIHYISTYSSFIGEVFENIVYELLLQYAIKTPQITKFVLKGPHQQNIQNLKSGLMIDQNSQIVYKAGYKDVTEFDALFFTKDSVYFVESTIVKATTSLRKRLKKKKALLEILFPNLKIKALIILNEGVLGVNAFPSYCTVWLTKPLENDKLIQNLIYTKKPINKKLTKYKDKKLIHCADVRLEKFKYFDTLSWLLRKIRETKTISLEFLETNKVQRYFEIFSKFYIGHITSDTFVKLLKHLSITEISEDIPLNQIANDQVIVTIENKNTGYELVYYLKIDGGRLKKLEVVDTTLVVSNKDPKGFTAIETKYMRYIFKSSYSFTIDDIKQIENKIMN